MRRDPTQRTCCLIGLTNAPSAGSDNISSWKQTICRATDCRDSPPAYYSLMVTCAAGAITVPNYAFPNHRTQWPVSCFAVTGWDWDHLGDGTLALAPSVVPLKTSQSQSWKLRAKIFRSDCYSHKSAVSSYIAFNTWSLLTCVNSWCILQIKKIPFKHHLWPYKNISII